MTDGKKNIAVLGSTGSIGTQTLDIMRMHKDKFSAEILTAGSNAELLVSQAKEFQPNAVVIADESKYNYVKDALKDDDIKVFAGSNALEEVVAFKSVDIVLTALVGFAGLRPTVAALQARKPIALANKETMVVAGQLIRELAVENNVPILPVDSEHSAIFQCLQGEWQNNIKNILLTASGGAFRGMKRKDLEKIRPVDALRNPNWNMGAKVTVDSATLMNKGLEVIEARWLFGVDAKQIKAVVHPQSIIHSMVEFEDGSIKAQLSRPDMRLPIMYALSYPDRLPTPSLAMNIFDIASLTFEKPDTETFPCLDLAYEAIRKGGNMPCIMNAANEVAVKMFLEEKITFLQIADMIARAMNEFTFVKDCDMDTYIRTDEEVKQKLTVY
ncbi:MAG: 1-deoxy-D-xylulose-5-phosphate reductoisomerase [Bacteroidales bacterium]|nr:1-deoxy-D-xylulose-5-phosphate reductoisomerase [Bacteroidales bacterium]